MSGARMSADVMKSLALWCLAAAATACGVQLEDVAGVRPDGRPGPSGDGPDGTPQCPNGRVVYLNFDGQTLSDAPQSDAVQNHASWMTPITRGTAPPYKATAVDRDQQIQAIVSGVRSQLSSFPISVVTARPAAGPYVMIVFGGTRDQVGSNFSAVNELDCTDAQKSDVAWIADGVSPTQRIVNYAIGAIGFGIGLTATSDPRGCMCSWANNCTPDQTGPCRLSTMIARDPSASQRCAGTSQDEVAAFSTAFCQ